jgi:hypothetical protein
VVQLIDRFTSDRFFQVWAYSVSHSQLLLRSVKADGLHSRIDVLFEAVDLMELPTSFTGLVIARDRGGFTLSGSGWAGRVVAGACYWCEDEGEYYDPSPFADSFGPALKPN